MPNDVDFVNFIVYICIFHTNHRRKQILQQLVNLFGLYAVVFIKSHKQYLSVFFFITLLCVQAFITYCRIALSTARLYILWCMLFYTFEHM